MARRVYVVEGVRYDRIVHRGFEELGEFPKLHEQLTSASSCACLKNLHYRLQKWASRPVAPHAAQGPYVRRSRDELMRSLQSRRSADLFNRRIGGE